MPAVMAEHLPLQLKGTEPQSLAAEVRFSINKRVKSSNCSNVVVMNARREYHFPRFPRFSRLLEVDAMRQPYRFQAVIEA